MGLRVQSTNGNCPQHLTQLRFADKRCQPGLWERNCYLKRASCQVAKQIFISYSRHDADAAKSIVADLGDLKHDAWYDQELSGGQAWWDQILANIRDCDYFLFILSQSSLDSVACQREFTYAAELNCPILPLLVGDNIAFNLLPPALSQIQILDYRKRNDDPKIAIISLVNSLNSLPARSPLPTPLPTPPEVPLSYLGKLALKLSDERGLSREEQSQLVMDLKAAFRDPATHNDARVLMKRLGQHPEVLASIAREIDDMLNASVAGLPESQAPSKAAHAPARRNRAPARVAPAELEQPAPNRMASDITTGSTSFSSNIRRTWAKHAPIYSRLAGGVMLILAFISAGSSQSGEVFRLNFGLLLMLIGFLRWVEQPKEYLPAKPWSQLFSLVLIFYGFIAPILLILPVYFFDHKILGMVLLLDGIISTILSFSFLHLRFWQLRAFTAFALAITGLIVLASSSGTMVVYGYLALMFVIAAIFKLIFGNFLF